MKKEEFAEVFGDICEVYIQEAETENVKNSAWHKWAAAAACFCLFLGAAVVTPRFLPEATTVPPVHQETPVPDETVRGDSVPKPPVETTPAQPDEPEPAVEDRVPWTIYFNEASSVLSAERQMIKGYFTEALSHAELAALKPAAELTCSGYAGFDQNGNLLDVILTVSASKVENPVTVAITDYYFGPCYVLPGDEVISVCEKVEYRAYQYELGGTITLAADTIIGDLYYHFSVDTAKERLEQAKTDFQYVLECFADYKEGKPDLSAVKPEEIPELMEKMFETLSEARTEADFGRYLPSELPDGFGESAIRRFRFQNSDYLSALWSRGLDDLSWVISPYTEADSHRLTDVDQKENYDLSLYPIPRADSVPDHLREIVDNPIFDADELTLDAVYARAYRINDSGDTDGWRMKFSVRYGDVVVTINAKGVEPEWLYQQLTTLNG